LSLSVTGPPGMQTEVMPDGSGAAGQWFDVHGDG
jgi:hypothetical protein